MISQACAALWIAVAVLLAAILEDRVLLPWFSHWRKSHCADAWGCDSPSYDSLHMLHCSLFCSCDYHGTCYHCDFKDIAADRQPLSCIDKTISAESASSMRK
eukprot:TRINITY_DN59052_c0_g1_i1.p1 TRINITY_DN59052_c0_g1~~TRINITY_DN59052_c0_g1_i1.p1  ORF type:complete len:102 (+),score=4.49 TRINITY_DN59052_c0_g1_i1:157-462(+)